MSARFEKSVSWRVLSTRGSHMSDAGYWTSSYMDREDALEHAKSMKVTSVYEVTDKWLYEDDRPVQMVSETWSRLL